MSKRIPMLKNKTLIRGYVDQISDGMKGVAAQMLEVGKIVLEAEEQLEVRDLEKLKAEIANRGVMSASTWSKFKKIGEKNLLHKKSNVKLLPPSWTTIYEMTTLSDERLKNAFERKEINPNIERSSIKALQQQLGKQQQTVRKVDHIRLVEITIPSGLDSELVRELMVALNDLTAEYGATPKFAEKPLKQHALKTAELELKPQLDRELARMGGKRLSKKRRKLYEETMFQLRKNQVAKSKTGKQSFPYRKQDLVSVENPRHEFYGYDLSQFDQKLLEEKVVTQFTDLTYFTKEEGRLKCLALGLLYCTAENANQRRNHLKRLVSTVRAGQKNAKYAQEVLDTIGVT